MFVTKKAISRRTVLRGVGVTLALPLLDSMVPALTALGKTAAKPINRFSVVYVPNSMIMPYWTPIGEGASFEFNRTMQALEPFRSKVLVLSGLSSLPTPGRPGGAHAKGSTRFLTDVTPPTSETWLDAGISMDQIIANETGKETQLASLELAIESSEMAGACDAGFACPYNNTISWRSANTPLPMQNNPSVVFERMFGDSGSTDPAARLARLAEDRSVLDAITEEVASLHRVLGNGDRTKLTEYLESVRDVERRIGKAVEQSDQELPLVEHPAGIPTSFDAHVKLMFDLEALAYQTDVTRVITFMLGFEQSGMTYPQIGVPDAHHPITHHQNDREKIENVAKINVYHVELLAYFLGKLQETRDGNGTLLDNITVMYGSGLADHDPLTGNDSHSPLNIPLLLAGEGAGHLKGGRHIKYPKDTRLANLHLTLLDQLGVPCEKIGDSTGRLDDHQLSI